MLHPWDPLFSLSVLASNVRAPHPPTHV